MVVVLFTKKKKKNQLYKISYLCEEDNKHIESKKNQITVNGWQQNKLV